MLRVIELHVEALLELIRKSLPRWVVAVHVLVTDRAHRNVWRRKLRQMTAGAGFMPWETWPYGIVSAAMAVVATERGMLGTCMEEL